MPINLTNTNPKSAWETTFLGKVLRTIGTGERVGTKMVLAPLMKALYPEAAARIEALQGDVYGGDVIRAINPGLSDFAAGITGAFAGGLVDPTSYVTLGGLTAAGRGKSLFHAGLNAEEMAAAGSKSLRAATMAEQAARGERDLLRLTMPWSNEGPTLIRGEKFYKGLDVLKGGKAAQTVAARIAPDNKTILEAARRWDTFSNSAARKLNTPFGMNPWLNERLKYLWSAINGHQRYRNDKNMVAIVPAMREFTRAYSAAANIPEDQAFEITRSIVRDVLEAHSTIGKRYDFTEQELVAKGLTESQIKRHPRYVFEGRPEMDEDQILLDVIENMNENLPLPINVSSNAHPLDTPLMRNAKKMISEARAAIHNADDYQRQYARDFVRLWSDNEYLAKIQTPELTAEIDRMAPQLVPHKIGLETGARPSTKLSRVTRRMRIVNPTLVDEYIEKGMIPQFVKIQKTVKDKGVYKTRKFNFDLHASLQKSKGRLISPAAFSAVQEALATGQFGDNAYDIVSKLFPSVSISEANDLIYKYGIRYGKKFLVEPGKVKKAFQDDPLQLITRRGAQAERAVLSTQFFEELKFRSNPLLADGTPNPDHLPLVAPKTLAGKEGYEHAKDWISVPEIKELEGYVLEPDAARHLARLGHSDVYINEHLYNFLDRFKTATKWMKNYTLSIFPSYHVRNNVTNMWQYYLGETHDPTKFVTGIKDGYKFSWDHLVHGRDYQIDLGEGRSISAKELREAMEKRNGLGIGFVAPDDGPSFYKQLSRSRDVDREITKIYRKNGWDKKWKGLLPPNKTAAKLNAGDLFSKALGKDGEFVNLGFKIGEFFDNQIRTSHVINRLREGYTMDNAIQSMKKYFFDYHDLSPLERELFRYVLPFYTWSRKNIPFQLEALIREPGRLARFHGFLQGYTGSENPREEEYTPDYFRKNFGIRVRKNPKNGQYEYFMLKNWLSVADLQELAYLNDFFLTNLNPIARVPIELISNHNFFTDQKIDKLDSIIRGERQKYMKIPNVPNKVAHVASSFRLTNTLHNLMDNPQDLDTISKVSYQILGRMYPLDVTRGQYWLLQNIRDAKDAMNASIRSAQRRNAPPSEIERLVRIGTENIQKAYEGIGPELREP